MLSPSPTPRIFLVTIVLLIVLAEGEPSQAKINSSMQLTLMTDEQYHFIPSGSFFQYSLASWEEGGQSKYINKIAISYNIQILSPNPNYNFIVLYTDSDNQQSIYDQLNCYIRATNEGLEQLMQNCNFTPNSLPNGSCSASIQNSSKSLFGYNSTFFNCTDTQISYVIQSDSGTVGPTNGTFLFIIDNSGLFANGTGSTSEIKLILTQEVITNVDEQQRAKLYLFSGLTAILIVILLIVAIALVLKIRKVDRELTSEQRNKAE